MGIFETLRVVMRNRIVNSGIVDNDRYQREYSNVPDNAVGYYIRETLIDMSRVEPSQNTELQTILCEYDVIVSKNWLNPTVTAHGIADKLREEFNVKNPEKINVELPDMPNVQAWIREPVSCNAAKQEEDFYVLPVLVYVECLVSWGK